jgi:hypothetical protein
MSRFITATDVIRELETTWPGLKDIWPMDQKFMCPSQEALSRALALISEYRSYVNRYFLTEKGIKVPTGFQLELGDCDNFALELQGDMSRYVRILVSLKKLPKEEQFAWAFGTVLMKKFRGRNINHAVNICRIDTGEWLLVEPQDFTISKANKVDDVPYFVEIR